MLQESYSQIVKLFIFSVSLALSAFCCGVKFTVHSQNKPEITNVLCLSRPTVLSTVLQETKNREDFVLVEPQTM